MKLLLIFLLLVLCHYGSQTSCSCHINLRQNCSMASNHTHNCCSTDLTTCICSHCSTLTVTVSESPNITNFTLTKDNITGTVTIFVDGNLLLDNVWFHNLAHTTFVINGSVQITDSRFINSPLLILVTNTSELHIKGTHFTNYSYSLQPILTITVRNVNEGQPSSGSLNVVLSDCHFINSNLNLPIYSGGVAIYALDHVVNGSILISNCNFHQIIGEFGNILHIKTGNLFKGNISLSDSRFISNGGNGLINIAVYGSYLTGTYHNNTFTNNTGQILTLLTTHSNESQVEHFFTHLTVNGNMPASTITRFNDNYIIQLDCIDECHNLPIHFEYVCITDNIATNNMYMAVVYIHNVNMSIFNSTFNSNEGTALYVRQSSVCFGGEVSFSHNHGQKGGGLAVYGTDSVLSSFPETAVIEFFNNTAAYGGALYINSTLPLSSLCSISMSFSNNIATDGSDAYFQDPSIVHLLPKNCSSGVETLITNASTPPSSSNSSNNVSISVFPGQPLILDLTIRDGNGRDTHCLSNVKSVNHTNSCSLVGLPYLELYSGRIITNLYYTTTEPPLPLALVDTLILSCDNLTISVNVDILKCPVGYEFNSTCVCSSLLHCSNGSACVPEGSWFGYSNNDSEVVKDCRYYSSYCNISTVPCPFSVNDQTTQYIALPSDLYLQCIDHHDGIVCSQCANGYSFSYQGLQCVSECTPIGAGIVFIFVIISQLILSVLLLLVLKLTIVSGAEGLLTPLFYIAAINQLPLQLYPRLNGLNKFITVVTSFLFLDMKMFGLLPMCSFHDLGLLWLFSFSYLGPMITSSALLLISALVMVVPKFRIKFQYLSIQHVIALLFLLMYWTYISTSLRIMSFVNISGDHKVALQPDISYFTQQHGPLWLFAFIVIVSMTFVCVPFLLFSRLLRKFRRLKFIDRLKRFLEFYQFCYKDNFHWYSAVYFIAFFAFAVSVLKFSPTMQQIILITLIMLQYFLRPYNIKWMNISDMLLLVDLLFVTSLISRASLSSLAIGTVYILVIISLLYIILGGILMALYRAGIVQPMLYKIKKRFHLNKKSNTDIEYSTSEVVMMDSATTGYREPLLDPLITLNSSDDLTGQYGL